jgi:hypothetical protein
VKDPQAYHLRRYPTRAIIGITGPLGTFLIYFPIYNFWLRKSSARDGIRYGPPHGYLLFYVWFIVCIVGIGVGQYGLSGAEAGMVMHPRWRSPHAGHIMLQVDKTWSGPGGWLRAAKSFFKWRNRPSRAWSVLSVITLLSHISLPLSGLTLELTPGYTDGTQPAVLYGLNSSTFHSEGSGGQYKAHEAWILGALARPPGRGVIYTGSTDEESPTDLSSHSVSQIFLAPQ